MKVVSGDNWIYNEFNYTAAVILWWEDLAALPLFVSSSYFLLGPKLCEWGGGGRRGMGMGVGWGSGGGQSQWLYCVYRMRLCFRVSICLCVTENTSILFCLWNSSILFCQDCVSVCPSIYVSLKIHLYCSAYEMHLYILFAKIFCPSVYMSMKVHLYCSAYEMHLSIVFGL